MSANEHLGEGGPVPKVVPIVRYPNRRFYDRSQGKYVTLQDIAEMVKRGASVTVSDSRTGDDLTRAILTQIILDHHPERMDLFPVPVLHMMIQANDLVLGWLANTCANLWFTWTCSSVQPP